MAQSATTSEYARATLRPEQSTRASVVRALPQSAAPSEQENIMLETVVVSGGSAGVGRAAARLGATEHRGALIAGTLAIVAFVTTLIIRNKPLARGYQTSSEPARLDEPGQ
jgi:hypothetical protein